MTTRKPPQRRSKAAPPPTLAMGYAITEDAHTMLCRAQIATQLLAALTDDVAAYAGIPESGPAVVADYVARDLETVLDGAMPLHPLGGEPPIA